MNIAVTDGIQLMPPAFEAGLGDWSRGDGRPGDPVYVNGIDAALVSDDGDFGPCIEIEKTETVQKLRWTGQTPILPGTYLRISARVKVVGGNRPSVRMACFAADGGGNPVASAVTTGPAIYLENFNRVYDVTAILGTGGRAGVDMPLGTATAYAHVGLDITGDNGGFIRVESIRVEDATGVFARKLIDSVDVKDFGAVGDGIADDTAAFAAADQEATESGRRLLISDGLYRIDGNLTLDADARFEGRIAAASIGRLAFTRGYDFARYLDAFEDEQVALEKALAALYNFTDHESLDLGGRRIQLTRPIDVAAIVGNKTTFGNRRAIRNGQLEPVPGPAWDSAIVTATASYSSSQSRTLSGIANAAAIAPGSLVQGQGVGREVYATAVDPVAGTVTLSQPLWGAPASQSYTFTRFRYLLDYSGFESINRQIFENIEFLCGREASAILLAQDGIAWHFDHCWFVRPKDRGITSFAGGCNGLTVETCQFISGETDLDVGQRSTVALNTNSNDMKIRNNRAVQFRHFAVMAGGGHLILGNHWWQGDGVAVNAERSAGLLLTQPNLKTTITGNYCDNAWIEISNEHDATPGSGLPFGNVTITGNIFTASDIPFWFTYIRLAPHAAGRPIDGIAVIGNAFKTIGGDTILRVDGVDTARGTIDHTQTRDVTFIGNSYESVAIRTEAPLRLRHQQTSEAAAWTVATGGRLPFEGRARWVGAITAEGQIRDGSQTVHALPWWEGEIGSDGSSVRLHWPSGVSGAVAVEIRTDRPL
ncbi:MAG: glycosyl hydrolase family 28-related protein [Rubricella sp.]